MLLLRASLSVMSGELMRQVVLFGLLADVATTHNKRIREMFVARRCTLWPAALRTLEDALLSESWRGLACICMRQPDVSGNSSSN